MARLSAVSLSSSTPRILQTFVIDKLFGRRTPSPLDAVFAVKKGP